MKYSKDKNCSVPDPLAKPDEKKSDEYGLQYARYIDSYYNKSCSKHMWYHDRDGIYNRTMHMMGKQSEDKYKPMIMSSADHNSHKGWVAMNWRIRDYATKRFNIAKSKLSSEEYDPIFRAIDTMALDDKKQYKYRIKAYQENKAFIESLGLNFQLPELQDKEAPETPEEIDVHMSVDYKHRAEMEMEMGVELLLHWNEYDDFIKNQLAGNWIAHGYAGLYKELDTKGKPRLKPLSVDRVIVPNSEFEDFRDIKWGAVRESYSIHTLKSMDPTLTDERAKELLEAKSDRNKKSSFSNTEPDNVDGEKVDVLKFWFVTSHEDVYKKKGGKFYEERDYNKGLSKVYEDKKLPSGANVRTNGKYDIYRDSYEVVYEGYWVVGTEYIFDYGIKSNLEREKNSYNVEIPFILFAPNMMNNRVTSIGQQMIAKLEDIQNIHLKIQHLLATAIPKGAAISLESLRNVSLTGPNGKKMSELDLLSLYYQRGVILYEDKDYAGMPGSTPIHAIENGLANDIVHYIQLLQMEIRGLDEIIGFNEITSASSVHQDTLKSVAEMQMVATNTAFEHLFKAQRNVYKRTCKSLANMYIDTVKNGQANNIATALGHRSIDFIGTSDIDLHEFGMEVEIRPTAQEWAALEAELVQSQAKGLITTSDKLQIKRIKNLKQAQMVFSVKEKKRAKEQQEMQMQNAQTTFQGQQESAQLTSQLKIQEEMEIGKIKVMLEQEKRKTILMLEQEKRKTKMLELQHVSEKDMAELDVQGDQAMEQIHLQGEMSIAAKVVDNSMKPQEKKIPKK